MEEKMWGGIAQNERLNFLERFMFMCTCVLLACLSVLHVCTVPMESTRGLGQHLEVWLATMWVLGIESEF